MPDYSRFNNDRSICAECKVEPTERVSYDPKYRSRYCRRCLELRRIEGRNLTQVHCKVCNGAVYVPVRCVPDHERYARLNPLRVTKVEPWDGFCRECRFEDKVKRGAKVVWKTNDQGREYRIALFDGEDEAVATRFDREDVI